MSKAMEKIKVDGAAIAAWASENNMSLGSVSARLGRTPTYMGNIVRRGEIMSNVYYLMLELFNLPEGSFVVKEPEKKKEVVEDSCENWYSLGLTVKPDRVKMFMYYQGELMYDAWSYIRGQSELDLMQAISYAAHMMYKKAEQTELSGRK